VRYRPEDISAWLETRPTGGENGAPARVAAEMPQSAAMLG
jgi:hypothetical protein